MKKTNILLGLLGITLFSGVSNLAIAAGIDGNYVYSVDDIAIVEPSIIQNEIEPIEKRLNSLRTDPSEAGVWARGTAGDSKIREFKYDFKIASIGYDIHKENEARHLFVGLGVSYSQNKCDDKLLGEAKSTSGSVYASWLGREKHDFVDVIVKYGVLKKDYTIHTPVLFRERKEDYSKNTFNFAVKYGRRFEQDNGWYWEPSVGWSYGHISSKDYRGDYLMRVHADSIKSNIASLGLQVGTNVKGTEVYGKVEMKHEFDGVINVHDNLRNSLTDDMGGTWYKVGIGAARKINKNNSFYMDIEKDFGNKVKKPYAIGAGYRYTF